MNLDHVCHIRRIPAWDLWTAWCTCGWESRPEHTRPEAIRLHTIHTFQLAGDPR